MLERAEKLARKHRMLPDGSMVLCAVSGGADSMCLLHWLSRQNGITLHAAHFDHRLRGAESTADAEFVRNICQKWGLPLHMGDGDVRAYVKAEGLTVEEGARRMRYAFLLRTAEQLGPGSVLATAHNADDNAETILFRLLRGTGLKGLCGIPPVRQLTDEREIGTAEVSGEVRHLVVRPLLTTVRDEILSYLTAYGIPHREDSSNADETYTRNRLRRQVIPVLKELNPGAVERIGETAQQMWELDEELERAASNALSFAGWEKEALSLPVDAVEGMFPRSARPRLIQLLLDQLGVGRKDFGAVHLRAVLNLKPGGHLDLPSGVAVDRDAKQNRLVFTRRPVHYNPRAEHDAVDRRRNTDQCRFPPEDSRYCLPTEVDNEQ